MIKVKLDDASQIDALMSAEEYDVFVTEARARCATSLSRANSAKRCFALLAWVRVDELFGDVPEK